MKKVFLFLSITACITPALTQTIIFSEDFDGGIPESWTINPISSGNPDSLENAVWKWATNESQMSSDYWIDFFYMDSPTASNGFAIFDAAFLDSGGIASDDPPTSGTGSAPTPLTSELILPTLDCSALETVAISFHQRYYRNNSVTRVGVSTDGGNSWDLVTPNLYLPSTKDYQHQKIIDLTPYAALEENVLIKFRYEGGYYYWAIDDVVVSELPEYDISIDEVLYPLHSYAQPASQVNSDTFDFSLKLTNHGRLAATEIVVQSSVLNDAGQVLFQDSTILAEVDTGTTELQVDLPQQFIPEELPVGNYEVQYEIYHANETDFTPINNLAVLPFEITEQRYAKNYGTYFGAGGWPFGDYRLGNQYRTGKNWSGGFKATKVITQLCCQPNISGKTVPFYLYKVRDEIAPDWSNFDNTSDNSLILVGYGSYSFTTEDFLDPVELFLFDAFTNESGVPLDPNSRYFLVAEFNEENSTLFMQIDHKIDYGYRLTDNSTVMWNGSVWYLFGSGTPSYGGGGQILQMEISMDVSDQQWETVPSTALLISPNPAYDHINIGIDLKVFTSPSFQLTLADATGRIIRQQVFEDLAQKNMTWPVDQLQSGVYFLRLSTSQGSRTKKVVVQR